MRKTRARELLICSYSPLRSAIRETGGYLDNRDIWLCRGCSSRRRNSEELQKELSFVDGVVSTFADFRKEYGKEDVVLFVVSEYGFVPVKRHVCLNRVLRKNGLLVVREIGECEYIDFEQSNAFAVVDHQIAHIYRKTGVVEA